MKSPLEVAVAEHHDGHLYVLTMNRPAAKNAMDSAMLTELVDALADADADPDLRGLLLAGADGVFSAGADVREPMDDGGRRRMELFSTFYEQLSTFRAPTVAAVEGPAIGGGAEAAAACDVRFAGRSAHFKFPGAIYGIPVGAARTVGLVGLGVAKDWVLSSRDISVVEAKAAGFVQRIVDDGDAVAAGRAWLEEAASRDANTVQLLKRLLNDFEGVRDRVAFENDALRAQQESGALPPSLDRDLPRTVRPRRQ
ncbi:MAG: enoyl-CoA hydratase/isomerase family protein [Nitriliruptorales bacterium]|nr:enoyl-CoA hydratase/isomerase family protein [Nitriliruptorales bacterium]